MEIKIDKELGFEDLTINGWGLLINNHIVNLVNLLPENISQEAIDELEEIGSLLIIMRHIKKD